MNNDHEQECKSKEEQCPNVKNDVNYDKEECRNYKKEEKQDCQEEYLQDFVMEVCCPEPKVLPEMEFLKRNYWFYGLGSLLYGIFYTLCLYHNTAGITYPFLVAGTFIACIAGLNKMKKSIQKKSLVYLVLAVLLGVSTFMTSNPILHFFNGMGILLLILLFMTKQVNQDEKWGIGRYIGHLFLKCVQVIGVCYYPISHFVDYRKVHRTKKSETRKYIYIGLAIGIPLAFFVILLLARADEIFSSLFGSFFSNNLISARSIGMVMMVIFGFFLMYSFFAATVIPAREQEKENKEKAQPLIAITFTGILTAVYLLFCAIQVMYLFAGGRVSLPDSFTYAEYARKGFFELLFVSMVNLIVVMIGVAKFKEHKILKGCMTILSLCTYIIIASSAYRMVLYVQQYHLTFLRILVLWFLGILAVLITGAIVSIYMPQMNFFIFSVLIGTCGYLIFSMSKPDSLIARYNIAHLDQIGWSDIYYLTNQLSDDAAPEIAKIDQRQMVSQGTEPPVVNEIDSYFIGIQDKYRDLTFLQWNISKLQAKTDAENWLNRTEIKRYD